MINLVREHFIEEESDCTIVSEKKEAIQVARGQLVADRQILKRFVHENPNWLKSLVPIHTKDPPQVVKLMEDAAEKAQVGPMAAVAGVLADRMQNEMFHQTNVKTAVVENGGEIAINSVSDIIIGLYVLTTALKANIGFRFKGGDPPLGIGTSSGQFGHALSFGEADAVTIFADTAGLGDAAATRICNSVKGKDHEKAVQSSLEIIDDIDGVSGAFIVRGKYVGQKGKIPELIRIQDGEAAILSEKFKFQ
jgi:hypothetical protein